MTSRDTYIGKLIKLDTNDEVYGYIKNVDEYGWTVCITVVPKEKRHMHDTYHNGDTVFRNHATPFRFKILSKNDMVKVYKKLLLAFDKEINKEIMDISPKDIDALYEFYKNKFETIFTKGDLPC